MNLADQSQDQVLDLPMHHREDLVFSYPILTFTCATLSDSVKLIGTELIIRRSTPSSMPQAWKNEAVVHAHNR